jgi:DNA-binding XRE family transcriptional regulator
MLYHETIGGYHPDDLQPYHGKGRKCEDRSAPYCVGKVNGYAKKDKDGKLRCGPCSKLYHQKKLERAIRQARSVISEEERQRRSELQRRILEERKVGGGVHTSAGFSTSQDALALTRLRERREAVGLTVVALAAESGVDRRSIVRYEYEHPAKRRKAVPQTIRKLAEALGCEGKDLL